MKKIYALPGLLAMLSLALSACGMIPQPSPTATATSSPSNTPPPTATFTPIPTDTPRPTSTPTKQPTVVAEGGYSFLPPAGYEVDIQGAQVGVFDQERTIIISIFGAASNPQDLPAEEIVDQFTTAVFKRGNGEYEKENPQTIRVDGVEGLSYEITGTLFGFPLQGQAVVVLQDDDRVFFGLGVANTGRDEKRWEAEGSRVFRSLLDSVTFLPLETSSTPCTISSDDTYGYTQENPIKVGGDAFDGPARERAYLDTLLGPNGEEITYERAGSIPFGDTVLDGFEISVAGRKVTLYIDEYSFTEPQAPVGFTCAADFPLVEP